MIKINTADGLTHCVDFESEDSAREWLSRLRSKSFQDTITGFSIVETYGAKAVCQKCGSKAYGSIGAQYSLSRPNGFAHLDYEIEISRENDRVKGSKVILYADDARIVMSSHRSQPSCRTTMAKVGKRKFKP